MQSAKLTKSKSNKLLMQLPVSIFTIALSASLLFVNIILAAPNSRASSQSSDSFVSMEIDSILSVNMSKTLLEMSTSVLGNEVEVEDSLRMTVHTNNQTGYTATLSSETAETALKHSNGTNTIPSTSNSTAASLGVNTWGYNLGASATSFIRIPNPSAPANIQIKNQPVQNDHIDVSVGAKVNLSALAGDYSNTLVLSVVANYIPAPAYTNWTGGDIYIEDSSNRFTASTTVTVGASDCQSTKLISSSLIRCTLPAKQNNRIHQVVTKNGSTTLTSEEILYDGNNKGNMQAFRTAQCSAMPRGQAQVWTDSRNSQTYRVKKMPDGKCWMIDNLRYAYGTLTSSGYLTVNGTSTQSEANSNVAKYVNPGTAGNASYCSAGADLSTCYGYLYNWYTATYGTGLYSISTNGNQVSGNICPNSAAAGSTTATSGGWRLPSSRSDASNPTGNGTSHDKADYTYLNIAMANDDGTTTSWTGATTNDTNTRPHWQPAGAFQGAYSGSYFSSLNYQGSSGYYWSSTAEYSTGAYYLDYYSGGVYPADANLRYYGFAVRCLVG